MTKKFSAKHVKIVAFPKSRAIHRGRFPLSLDDLTLWHDELPDFRETLLFSHVSLNKSWRDGQE